MLRLSQRFLPCFTLFVILLSRYAAEARHPSKKPERDGRYIVVFKSQISPEVIEEHHGWLERFRPPIVAERKPFGDLSSRSLKRKLRHAHRRPKPIKRIFRRISFGPKFDTSEGLDASVSQQRYPFNAYAGQFDQTILEHIQKRDEIEYIVPDDPVRLISPVARKHKRSLDPSTPALQSPLNFSHGNGTGVIAYVVDSGIYREHVDFDDRVTLGPNFIVSEENIDECGHGSHVAGTIGGKIHGLAKNTRLVSVKVFDHQGQSNTSTVMTGVEWAAKDASRLYEEALQNPSNSTFKGALINMSMSAPRNKAFNELINTISLTQGIPIVIAAGNEGKDACTESPASAEAAITVMAIDSKNRLAHFSDRGACTTLAAPGVDIASVGIKNQHATKVESGTSMAAAVVSGVISTYMSSYTGPGILQASQIQKDLISLSTKDSIEDLALISSASPNRIVAYAP